MPVTNHRPADTVRDLRYEVVFEAPGQAPQTLPYAQYLVALTIEDPAEGSWSGEMELFDPEGDYLENLLLSVSLTKITFRFWEEGQVSPYFVGGVTSIEPDFRPEGVGMKIGMVSQAVHSTALKLAPRGFPAGTNPSAIVRELARIHGWATVSPEGYSTVDEAANNLDHAIQTTGESDYRLILTRVLKHAVDASGDHFIFRLEGSTTVVVHFHARNALKIQKARRSYTYLRDPNGEVISFAPQDNTMGAWLLGGGNARIDSVDSNTGTATTADATNTKGLKGVSTPSKAQYVDKAPSGSIAARATVPGRTTGDTASAAAHAWSRWSQFTQTATLEVIGTHDVRTGEYVEVNYIRMDGTAHPMGGMFNVLLVSHEFGLEGWTTTFKLARFGQQYEDGKVKADTASIVAPEDSPPPGEASASLIKTGGGVGRGGLAAIQRVPR